MLSPNEIHHKFSELRIILNRNDKDFIKMHAHGGNSILFTYPPQEEKAYLERIRAEYPDAVFIDLAELFVAYIDDIGYEDFVEIYEEYASEPEKLFRSEMNADDLYQRILNAIQQAGDAQKIPILLRTGALYGAGIENINIMDSKIVHDLPLPLVIMYPAAVGADNKLHFLNVKPASDYRATVI